MRPRIVLLGLAVVASVGCQQESSSSPPAPKAEKDLAAFARGGSIEAKLVKTKRPPGAPFGLTASDGSGVKLVSIAARAVVQDPLAFTELHLVFENPEDRVREGTFSITLPEKASISRFSMKVGDTWQEGEVVERQAARRAYEDFLHRKQDPALLEHAAGNQFSARVFPIPARARKELILSYSEELGVGAPYVLPLSGLPAVDHVAVEATVGDGGAKANYASDGAAPAGDFLIERDRLSGADGLRSGNLAVVRVRPVAVATAEPLRSAVVLVDTSASRALGFEAQLNLVADVVRRIAMEASDAPVVVAAFDQTVVPMYSGRAADFDAGFVQKALARGALGASDLAGALTWAGQKAREGKLSRVVLVSDGVVTAGATKAEALVASARALADSGVSRLDAVLVGGIRDEANLKRLVTAGLSRPGVVIDGDQGPDVVARKLSQRAESDLSVRVDGASWWWPERIDNAQPGDEVLVYAEVTAGEPVRVSVGESTPVAARLVRTEPTLLSRAIVRARIAGLEDQAAKQGDAESIVQSIVELSTQNRVLSKYTALLVLETEADYARFKIDRTALADILTVRDGAVAVIDRRKKNDKDAKNPFDELDKANGKEKRGVAADDRPAPPSGPAAAPDTLPADPAARGNMWGADIGDAFGAGGLGLSGIGEGGGGTGEGIGLGSIGTLGHGSGTGSGQGFGSGHGRLSGSHRTSPPSVRMGAVRVTGPGTLPPEVIQRIVRQNFGRFRLCYENGLRQNPNLQGRVVTRFVIDRTGGIASVRNDGSDLPDAGVVNCIVRSFQGFSFPEPERGNVTVVFPIMLSPDGGGSGSVSSAPRYTPPEREEPIPKAKPYTGRFETVMKELEQKQHANALKEALAWRAAEPGDVLALIGLGEVFEAQGDDVNAARAYGSLIDLFPSRADLRRFAGGRLERIKGAAALDLAIDTFRQAVEQRPDHPASHRMLAMSLVKKGAYSEAFDVIVAGSQRDYPSGRFAGVPKILAEDVGLVAAAWIRAEPARRDEILAKVTAAKGHVEDAPSLRFIVTWETDANDLDFHIRDANGGHAYYGEKNLPNDGGSLYADVTTGYGPECFTIRKPKESRSPSYSMQAHYFSRGPMGYGMGKLSIIDHDGKGGLTFEERPFVVMVDHAFLDLGSVKRLALIERDVGRAGCEARRRMCVVKQE